MKTFFIPPLHKLRKALRDVKYLGKQKDKIYSIIKTSMESQNYEDKILNCRDCETEFTWTAGEQGFYAEKGFTNPPGRCRACRAKNKARQQTGGFQGQTGERVETEITCSDCGNKSTVPFVPRHNDGLLCRECFTKKKASEGQKPQERNP